MKMCDKNEQCLLKFISTVETDSRKQEGILEVISKLGLKINFQDSNPVYQIIDELTYANLIGK